VTEARITVLCADDDQQQLRRLCDALDRVSGDAASVEGFRNGARMRGRAVELAAKGIPVPVVFVDESLNDGSGVDALIAIAGDEATSAIRKVLLTSGKDPGATARAVRARALDSALTKPWTEEQLSTTLDRLVTQYFVEQQPEALEQVPELVDVEVLSHAFAVAEERERVAVERLEDLQRSFLGDRSLDDDEVERVMIEEIDSVLAHPERERFPAGSMLLRSGDPVDGVMIVLEGEVRLTLEVEGEEVVFHARTAGRIIGLLALARTQPAFFNVQAATDVVVLPLTLDEIDEAMRRSSTLAAHFVAVLVRSLARRNLRSVELQLERDGLARELSSERDQLAATLNRLTEAQTRLEESDRLAVLGRLVAGIGSRLDGPVTSIQRASERLATAIAGLAGRAGESALLDEALRRGPRSAQDEQAARTALAEALGNEALAERLIHVGIHDVAEYQRRFGSLRLSQRTEALATLELYHRLAAELRSIENSAERVAGWVKSLRAFVGADDEAASDVDIHEGLERSVSLLAHELTDVEVLRDYGDLPTIRGFSGALDQVWVTLIAAAAHAIGGAGSLTLTSRQHGGSAVVDVGHSGPGIPSEALEYVFDVPEPAEDRQGGPGLRIAHDVVERHGGTIEVASDSAGTRFTVTLPLLPRSERGGGEP
jgi:C4-dicarboxylate-specific signal transduction histidine kinase